MDDYWKADDDYHLNKPPQTTIFDDYWKADDDYHLNKPPQTTIFDDYWKSGGDYHLNKRDYGATMGRLFGDYWWGAATIAYL